MQTLIDTFRDCALDMTARLQRTLLLVIAVALGSGTFVMSLGSNITASNQIANDMAAGTLDQIGVSIRAMDQDITFPDDTEERAMTLPMVVAAGRRIEVDIEQATPNRFDVPPQAGWEASVSVAGITSGYFDVLEVGEGTKGAWVLDSGDYDNVAYLGMSAAETMGIPITETDPTGYQIFINGKATDVLGIVRSTERAAIDNNVFIPYRYALALNGNDSQATVSVRTELGAGAPVSDVLREVIRPDNPNKLSVTQVATLDSMRSGVDSQLSRLGISIGVVLLGLTTLLIAISMIVAVMSRTSEIGLRRALGSAKSDIARLFLMEGAITGFLGGLAGAAFGVLGNFTLAILNGWSVTMPLWLPFVGIGMGAVVGILASVYPSVSAARINPATAIRVD